MLFGLELMLCYEFGCVDCCGGVRAIGGLLDFTCFGLGFVYAGCFCEGFGQTFGFLLFCSGPS